MEKEEKKKLKIVNLGIIDVIETTTSNMLDYVKLRPYNMAYKTRYKVLKALNDKIIPRLKHRKVDISHGEIVSIIQEAISKASEMKKNPDLNIFMRGLYDDVETDLQLVLNKINYIREDVIGKEDAK